MKINEIAGIDQKRYKDYRLTKGVSGKGGEVGDIADMVKRHYDAWKRVVSQYQSVAKSNPQGLLQAWIEKFYGSSSAKVNLKKAENDYGVNTGMKGADAILRIAIGILMKPKTRVEMEAYYDQMKGKLDPKIDSEVGDPMPKAQQDPEPSAAQNQGSNIQGK
ncbi:MAG: hypothetical protein CBD31_01635 [Flavobacteriaceae bacterium TMED171]|nr:MAG: hypothetical protein CBD31_01635 [Flavobacteriaceae bacterium TMED171]